MIMKQIRYIITLLVLFSLAYNALGQDNAEREIVKKGFSFGGFPILAFDQDKGFQLGALANLYDFGKEGWYPNPRQQLYVEASWFTKGSQLYVLSYDNRFLIPGVRFSFTAQFSNEKAFDFYGFGGYASYFDASVSRGSSSLKSRSAAFSGCRVSALSSKFSFASAAISFPSAVRASGLISAREQFLSVNSRYRFLHRRIKPFNCSP